MKITITIDIPDSEEPAIHINKLHSDPDRYETLADVPRKTIVYVVPWAVYKVAEQYFISISHGGLKQKRGTAILPIALDSNGVHVYRSDLDKVFSMHPVTLHEMPSKWHQEDWRIHIIE